ncbi:hypothetical protein ACWC9S_09660 [Streptomyces xiamenensis]
MNTPPASAPAAPDGPAVDRLEVHAFRMPTDVPGGLEQDGTLEWSATTLVLVQLRAAGTTGTPTPSCAG